MKGSDERDGLFARLFGLTALVQSGALFRGDAEVFGQVMDALVELGRKKLYLRESAWWAIVQACDLLVASGVEWERAGIDKLASLLEGTWNQDKLALALRLDRATTLDWATVSSHALKGPILGHQNHAFLARILRDAEDESAWKPQLHHVWTLIFERLDNFVDFFRVVVDGESSVECADQNRYSPTMPPCRSGTGAFKCLSLPSPSSPLPTSRSCLRPISCGAG
jgi:DNA polymerase phi